MSSCVDAAWAVPCAQKKCFALIGPLSALDAPVCSVAAMLAAAIATAARTRMRFMWSCSFRQGGPGGGPVLTAKTPERGKTCTGRLPTLNRRARRSMCDGADDLPDAPAASVAAVHLRARHGTRPGDRVSADRVEHPPPGFPARRTRAAPATSLTPTPRQGAGAAAAVPGRLVRRLWRHAALAVLA